MPLKNRRSLLINLVLPEEITLTEIKKLTIADLMKIKDTEFVPDIKIILHEEITEIKIKDKKEIDTNPK